MKLIKTSSKAGIHAWFDVFCCGEACIDWIEGGGTRNEAATSAKRAGWRFHYRKGWLCPCCAEKDLD